MTKTTSVLGIVETGMKKKKGGITSLVLSLSFRHCKLREKVELWVHFLGRFTEIK